MGIESNKEAAAMMKNALGSIENRFREAYNKGYKDGLRDGASQVTAKIVGKILEEVEDEPQTEREIAKAIVHKMIDDAVIAEDAYPDLRQKMHDAVDEYEPQTEEPPMDEYYKDHDEFYDCARYVITNDEGERAYNCIGCQTDCAWR